MRKIPYVVPALFAAFFPSVAFAAAPTLIPVTGFLTDDTGAPINGTVDLDFDLYSSATDNVSRFHEAQNDVVVDNGRFTVYLGDSGDLSLGLFRDYGTLYLAMAVNGAADLSPRFTVGSAPYAGYAEYCEEAGSLEGIDTDDLAFTGDDVSWSQLTAIPADLAYSDDPVAWTRLTGVPTDIAYSDDALQWSRLTGIPADLADGDQNNQYTAGSGITLTGSQFSLTQSTVEGFARGVAYDSRAELLSALAGAYISSPSISCQPDQLLVSDGVGGWDCGDFSDFAISASQITSGTLPTARLSVGTAAGQVAAGNHTHTAADVGALALSGGALTGALVLSQSTVACSTTVKGGLRWGVSSVEYCDGVTWRPIDGSASATRPGQGDPALNTTSTARANCKAIADAGESKGSGIYFIKPLTATYAAYCDMSTSGGGWTMVMNVHPADGSIVSFTNTKFWKNEAEYGEIGSHFTNDYKGPAAWEVTGSAILVEVAKPGPAGSIIGWKAWSMPVRSFDTFFDAANNTQMTTDVLGSDTTNIYTWEPIVRNGTQLVSNRLTNSNGDRTRLGVAGYAAQGDDNQPGLGTQMNETSCGVGVNCYRYRDVELWINSNTNYWATPAVEGTFGWIGTDGGCGATCDDAEQNKNGQYAELWTYRIFVR